MRSQFPRHALTMEERSYIDFVSISDEKPVPSPLDNLWMKGRSMAFQSQMRSQFPRHQVRSAQEYRWYRVSISDEKPVPSPPHIKLYMHARAHGFNLR